MSVRRLSRAFSIAGYPGGWQFNTVMTDDERGLISLRINVFDCNWQSKMLFFWLIDLHSSTVISVFDCGSISLINSIFNFNWQSKTLFFRLFWSAFIDCHKRIWLPAIGVSGSRKLPWQIRNAYQKSLETAFSIATGLLIHVHRLSWAFSIAGYRGRWQAKSAMTDDKPGSKHLRNSVLDCNWQSKMQFLRFIDLSSSTVTSTF